MNFDELTKPVTDFLIQNGFSVYHKEQHFIRYTSANCAISIAYNSLEHIYYYHIGANSDTLIELTPKLVNEVFLDDRYVLQQSLTIDNFLNFLKGNRTVILGDKATFMRLRKFADNQDKEYHMRVMMTIFLKEADNAWKKKDYNTFVSVFEKIDNGFISDAFRKKYQIALLKSGSQNCK